MDERLPQHIGLDFGTDSIKLVFATQEKGQWIVHKIAVVDTPKNINILNSTDQIKIVEALKTLIKSSGLTEREVAIAIPEKHVFSRMLTLQGIHDDEIEQAVFWQIKQFLPYALEQAQKDYTVITKKGKTIKALAVAVKKELVQAYIKILEAAGLEPVAIEPEMLSIIRVIKLNKQLKDGMILDFGANTTSFGIFMDGALHFSQNIATGSDLFTRALVNEYNITYSQAEQYKRSYGLNKQEPRIYNVLKRVIDIITAEMLRAMEFFRNDLGEIPPNTVFLSGEGALLPFLPEYLKESAGIQNCTIIDPWQLVMLSKNASVKANLSGTGYTVATGLSIKTLG